MSCGDRQDGEAGDCAAGQADAGETSEASLKAEAIIQEALESRSRITTQAHEEGLRQGKEAGYRHGLREAETIVEKAKAELKQAMEERDRMIVGAESEIAKLALRIAGIVLKREISQDPETVLGLVRDALVRTRDGDRVTLRLNPVDAVVVRSKNGAMLRGTQVRQLVIEEDAGFEPGDCIVTTSRGDIDERPESQMRRIASVLESVDRDGSI
jgi:flagellar assembly protein FliH